MVAMALPIVDNFVAAAPASRQVMLETLYGWLASAMPPGYEMRLVRGRLSWIAPGGAVYVAMESGRYYCSVYLMHVGACPVRRARFREAWMKGTRPPWMNYARIRFRTLTDLDQKVLCRTIRNVSPQELLRDRQDALGYSQAEG